MSIAPQIESGDGVALTSAEHPYTVRGFDAWGNETTEVIEISPSRPRHPIRYFLMRLTPWWAWNIWYRLGLTKIRMITKITLDPDSIETAELDEEKLRVSSGGLRIKVLNKQR